MGNFKRGSIYFYKDPKSKDKDKLGEKICIVVSDDRVNFTSPNVTVVFCESTKVQVHGETPYPNHVNINALNFGTEIFCETVATVSKDSLVEFLGYVTSLDLAQIDNALVHYLFGANHYIPEEVHNKEMHLKDSQIKELQQQVEEEQKKLRYNGKHLAEIENCAERAEKRIETLKDLLKTIVKELL